ncbi:FMRFamide receptor [Patella vulgata]|uniref:FMRFamide receptor n=1 Tax=Patella vulgata TaxID=6465 RepID=UPI0021809744|nr:FMRFamide receptor [Patella vulgata]
MESYSYRVFFALGVVRIGLACFGVVGNILSVIVLAHRSMRSSTAVLLICLALYDTVFLVATGVTAVVGLNTISMSMSLLHIVAAFYPIRNIAQMGSVYATVILTVERFIAVAYPMKARIICTLSNSRNFMIGVFIFSVAFNIPRCLRSLIITPPMNVTANDSIPSDNYNFLYMRVYEIYLTTILYFLIPYTLIVILNIRLLMTLKKSRKTTIKLSYHNKNKQRRESTSMRNPTGKEDSLISFVIGITGCFFVCCFVPLVYNIIILAKPNLLAEATRYYLLSIGDTMLCVNAATDFIFYCLLGQRFRTLFIKTFCPFIRKSKTVMEI